MYAIDGKNMH